MSNYLEKGYLEVSDIIHSFPSEDEFSVHPVAISECVQEIPCNPCVSSCPTKAITMEDISSIPIINYKQCIGCGKCVQVCPGLALFLVFKNKDSYEITLPYEMLPLPKVLDEVYLLDRTGKRVGTGIVKRVKQVEKNTYSSLITVSFKEKSLIYEVRNIGVKNG
ncbi:MAG: 4Fe-4S binding protein [Caldisericaceae bacterium]